MSDTKKLSLFVIVMAVVGFSLATQLDKLPMGGGNKDIKVRSFKLKRVTPLKEQQGLVTQMVPASKPFVINFWATWCQACEQEKDILNQLWKDSKNESYELLSIASMDQEATVLKTRKRVLDQYPVLIDESGIIVKSLGIKNLPHTLVFDRNGRVKHHVRRALQKDDVSKIQSIIEDLNRETLVRENSELLPEPKAIEAFSLKDHHGKTFNNKSLKRQWSLAYLGFASCPDVCPTALTTLKKILRKTVKLKGVFVSVDPERDSLKKIKDYVSYFHPDILGVTGSDENLKKLARSFMNTFQKSNDPEKPNDMIHSTSFFLVNPAGELVAIFPERLKENTIIEKIVKIRHTFEPAAQKNNIEIVSSWIRESPPVAKINAGYLTIKNRSNKAVTLERVTSRSFARIELHQIISKDGSVKMEKLNQVDIPAQSEVVLKPGGIHLMLFEPKEPIAIGKKIEAFFFFNDGSVSRVDAPVKKY